jgi:hypothetical protein
VSGGTEITIAGTNMQIEEKKVTQIATSDHHSLALTSDGKVYGWGWNIQGQLGDGSTTNISIPVAVDMTGVLAGKTATHVATSYYHSLALTSDGKVYGWGENNYGQLGDGSTTTRHTPTAVDMTGALAGKTVTRVAANSDHSLALTSDGKVYGWGYNNYGQLGDGLTTDNPVPTAVDMTGALAGKTVTQIAAGYYHSLALTSDGKVYSWGDNSYSQLGDGSTTTRHTPTAVDMTTFALGPYDFTVMLDGQYCTDLSTGADNITTNFAPDGSWVKCKVPAHSAGTVDVIVNNGLTDVNLPNAYTYYVPMTITSMTPDSGSTTGGTEITVSGSNFGPASSNNAVTFKGKDGNSIACNIISWSDSEIICVTAAHAQGMVDVLVQSQYELKILADGYEYQDDSTVPVIPGPPNTGIRD